MRDVPYKYHLFAAYAIRLCLICIGDHHDSYSEVPYTDVDYKVFTDAARYVTQNQSPYKRHTYRYTPLLAYLLTPNIKLHYNFGKILFSTIDMFVGLLIREIVIECRQMYLNYKRSIEPAPVVKTEKKSLNRRRKREKSSKKQVSVYDHVPDYCMMFWIYNPMSIIISTRGNCDSIAAFLVLSTLYLLECRKQYFLAGIIHGFAIHIRLYPIAYSLSLFLYLSEYGQYNIAGRVKSSCDSKQRKTIFRKEYLCYLIPNVDQLSLIFGCAFSLVSSFAICYYLYGQAFLYETYIFHLLRKDTRHNFSLFFYLSYLTAAVKNVGLWQKVLMILPQVVMLLVLSVRYGLNKFTLNFSVVTQTIVMVSYNSVLTSQYFIWILAVLPLTIWQFRMTIRTAVLLAIIWFGAQLAWLLPAYLLEFHGQNTFMFVWLQGVSFFCANMVVLGKLIKCYVYRSGA